MGTFGQREQHTAGMRNGSRLGGGRELQDGRSGKTHRMSWQAFVDRYMDEVVPGFAEGSQEKAGMVARLYERHMKPKRLRDVTEESTSRFLSELREKGLKEVTIKGYFNLRDFI